MHIAQKYCIWDKPIYSIRTVAKRSDHCYRLQTKLRKGNVFTPVCQSFCSQGACMAGGMCGGGMHGGGVWQGVCMAGACVVGACMAGSMHGGGHVWWGGACVDWWRLAWQGVYMAGEMATAADGTHSTEMLSCLI